ncbi:MULTISPECIES: salicylate synthase [Streptomyces]|nr:MULTISPECIES: salicylate synthase [Streptomyces]QHF95563.1 salicylate synthase [Streptomyces sp. NHF165]
MPDGLIERHVPFLADRIATATVLCAGSDAPYLLYERDGSVSWAEGEAVVVEAGAEGATVGVGGTRRRQPAVAGVHPLAAAGRAVELVGRGNWRAHGWVDFSYVRARAGAGPEPGGRPAVRFVLPRREVRMRGSEALLRAEDGAALDRLERRLCAAADRAEALTHGDGPRRAAVPVDPDAGAVRYREDVARAVREIRAGRLEKVILSRTVPVPGAVDLPATYLAGRRSHEPARSFLLRHGGREAAGFSPEIVVRVGADGTVTAQPLAGTRALTGEPEADAERRAELYRDPKEVYEHAVSVRLVQTELESVCIPGTVRTGEFMTVEERGSVQHLASRLSGRLAAGAGRWSALDALFPAVTASGIPKQAACELIARSEPEERGLYSGAVVTVDADGTLDAALVLRSVYRDGGRTWLRAGAGIVAQSDPERELEETREKLRAVSRCLVAPHDVAAGGPHPEPAAPARAAS